MKMPKYILQVAGQQFAVPSSDGLATLIKMLEDAVPVHFSDHTEPPEIELAYDEDEMMRDYLVKVRITKIPARTVWKRKTKSGEVEIVRPVATDQTKPTKRNQPARLNKQALQLEFGR